MKTSTKKHVLCARVCLLILKPPFLAMFLLHNLEQVKFLTLLESEDNNIATSEDYEDYIIYMKFPEPPK